jgi:hypothetical protein
MPAVRYQAIVFVIRILKIRVCLGFRIWDFVLLSMSCTRSHVRFCSAVQSPVEKYDQMYSIVLGGLGEMSYSTFVTAGIWLVIFFCISSSTE